MTEVCRIPHCIEKILGASHCGCAYIGGSLTVGVGASNTATTCWRALFTRYLYRTYHPVYHCQVSEIMGAIGAMESPVAAFTLNRNVLPCQPDLALVEFCVNDAGIADSTFVIKGMEGIVRQLLSSRGRCDVILLGHGNRQNTVDSSRHRRVADHYGLPFVDFQAYLLQVLQTRGLTWDDIDIEFEANDSTHLNDLGNQLCFEALRQAFEEQVALYKAGKRLPRRTSLPPPLVSDELQFTELIDPARGDPRVTLEGKWDLVDPSVVPWYFDHLLAGHPGDQLTLRFRGTAVALFGLMYHHGLKGEATLDGQDIPGAYLRHFIEFGKGTVLAHGLPLGEHTLELRVGQPVKRHHKLPDPRACLGYLGIACPPQR